MGQASLSERFSKWWDSLRGWSANGMLVVLVIILLVVPLGGLLREVLSTAGGDVTSEVVAYWQPVTDTHGVIHGRVLRGGEPVYNARVWAVMRDQRGNRTATGTISTDSSGQFELSGVERLIAGAPTIEAALHVRPSGESQSWSPEVLSLAGKGARLQKRAVRISFWWVAYVPGIFLASILLAFIDVKPTYLRNKYNACLTLALGFTLGTIVAISLGISFVNSWGHPGEVLSLGFATVFHSTYVGNNAREWIMSVTAAPQAGVGELARGLGAPLWVLLLGVIGASLKTVQIVLMDIKQRPKEKKDWDLPPAREWVRERITDIVSHQFSIFFAPLGAVFVYQALLAGDAANSELTVGIAALGAGATLDVLLSRAWMAAARAASPVAGEIREIEGMLSDGLISQAEFKQKRQELLGL